MSVTTQTKPTYSTAVPIHGWPLTISPAMPQQWPSCQRILLCLTSFMYEQRLCCVTQDLATDSVASFSTLTSLRDVSACTWSCCAVLAGRRPSDSIPFDFLITSNAGWPKSLKKFSLFLAPGVFENQVRSSEFWNLSEEGSKQVVEFQCFKNGRDRDVNIIFTRCM